MPPSTPDPRTPGGGSPVDRDYETEVRLARWQADQNRKHAEAARDADMTAAQQRYHDTMAEIDRTEQAQIDNAKRRHGKDSE